MFVNILMLGDIIGRPGRKIIKAHLAELIKETGAHFVIANGENASGGAGLLESAAKELFEAGIDVLTSGNHIWNKKDISKFIGSYSNILRPANYPEMLPGSGSGVFLCKKNDIKIGVVNILGRTFMSPIDSPFTAIDIEIAALREKGARIIVVDFHAEATAEKEAMGFYLKDKVELLAGTHTHVQTSDEKIKGNRMGYITDLGRCGSYSSVIGFNEAESITGFLTSVNQKFEPSKTEPVIEGVIARIDSDSKVCSQITRIRKFC
jgi:2',3'-cyclic-nucleotide 2'-phosphodiesterase